MDYYPSSQLLVAYLYLYQRAFGELRMGYASAMAWIQLLIILALTGLVFLAWFTYDAERPPVDVTAILGEPGHRWITAQGPYSGDTATLQVNVTSGGIFDSNELPVGTVADGTMTVQFSSCNEGLISYQFDSIGLSGTVPIERIVLDRIPQCEALTP